MKDIPHIPPAVARKLGHYVYLYVDPKTNRPFYVGKGKGSRALAHLKSSARKQLTTTIRRIRAAGTEPVIEILSHSLASEKAAFQVESAVIDALTPFALTNRVRGWGSRKAGRASLRELVARYTGKKVRITEPTILIRINQAFASDLTPIELYDATRSAWRVGSRRAKPTLAMAVYEGVVREVYAITGWHPAGSTYNTRFDGQPFRRRDRWEFVGTVAGKRTRQRYINAYVGDHFRRGNANPIQYLNCD